MHVIEENFALAKAEERANALTNLSKALLAQRKKVEKAEAALKELKTHEDALERNLLQQMHEAGIESFRAGKQLFSRTTKANFTLPPLSQPEERAAVLTWLKRVGCGESVRLDIAPGTLSSLMRRRLEEKKPIHPILKGTQFDKISLSVRKK